MKKKELKAEFIFISKTARYANMLVVNIPRELYKKFSKGTVVEVGISKLK